MTPRESAPPAQWSGLEEYLASDAFREAMRDEFPEQAAEWTDPVTRRNFLSVMGASLALAGVVGCSPRPAPRRQIVPYTRQPEELTPGVPLFYATTFTLGGVSTGVIVRSHEGRPVKIEGNPDHPGCARPGDPTQHAGTDVITQASILDLYDPDRSRDVTYQGQPTSPDRAVQAAGDRLAAERAKPEGQRGAGVRVLTGAVAANTTLADQIRRLLEDLPQAKWCQYEPVGRGNAVVPLAAKGKDAAAVVPIYDFLKADVVVSLDADFLSCVPGGPRYNRDFAARRRVRQALWQGEEAVTSERLNRLYVVESMPTVTGSVADHRLPVKSSEVEAFARALAGKFGLGGDGRAANPTAQKWVDAIHADLTKDRPPGTTVVVPGDHQPPAVHALALAINERLGNVGKTVTLLPHQDAAPAGKGVDFPALVEEMKAGKVETLFVLGCPNPAYSAPADLDFAGALGKVPFSLHLGTHKDETAVLCTWHVNETHYLESWGDGRAYDGTASLQQPLIAPLFGGKSAIELIAAIRSGQAVTGPQVPTEGRDIVRAFWREWWKATPTAKGFAEATPGFDGFEPFWQESVRRGVVENTATAPYSGPVAVAPPAPTPARNTGGLEINFRADPTLYDGRFANNGWLQELPKPVTKMTWDNAAYVGVETAEKLKAGRSFPWTAGEHGRAEVSVLTLEYQGRQVRVPVWALPGHPEDAVTVHLGHGRDRAGRVGYSEAQPNAEGKNVRGFNAFALRTSGHPWFDGGAKLDRPDGTYFLACTQGQWSMSGTPDPISGKPIDRRPARRLTRELYEEDPHYARVPPAAIVEAEGINRNVPGGQKDVHGHDGFAPESGAQNRRGLMPAHEHEAAGKKDDHGHGDKRLHPLTMYHPNDNLYAADARQAKRRWGMAIDLGACTGCNACVVACQSENNIPVVGKLEITRGHEMYWIRVDRYYEGDPKKPETLQTHFQPLPCMQCEKAPCEVVCPVAATVHSADGLNDMVYNRCVGTRYCANNCPYKVRRFNFLTYQDWTTDTYKLGRNPEVSVRSRGVMEKCTYCVQRIRFAEIVAEREGREIRDGEVRTACQTACPSGAIMFGDLGDPESRVGRWKAEPTNYGLLAELNTMPRTTYLAGVRNPNPALLKQ